MHRNLLRQGFGVSGAAYDEPLIDSLIFPLREPSRAVLSMSLAAASSIVDPCHVGRRASNDPGEPNGSLVVRADVIPHLVMPVGPFVPALRAPVVQMMSNSTTGQHLRHSVSGPAVLPRTTAGRESDVATRVLV